MKTVVVITLPKNGGKFLVDSGDEVMKGETIAQTGEELTAVVINLAELLNVKAGEIFKFLKKKPTENVFEGELLAEKKSLLTTLSIRSPISGKIAEIDLKKGTVSLLKSAAIWNILTIPVSGKVKKIEGNSLSVEVNGIRLEAAGGQGEESVARLITVRTDKNTLFDIGTEVEECILVMRNASAEVLAKLDTLEAKGIICQTIEDSNILPNLVVGEDTFNTLLKNNGKPIWFRPEARELVILEDNQ